MKEPNDKTSNNPARRHFLRNVGLGTVAAGAAVAVGHVTLAQAQADETKDAADAGDTTYRETDHVKAFYATLRD
ncbi:secreted protein [Chromohalobacter marismortui]|uniref:Secreted protein n=1 Tax=Chromohalobacter marismortui TaxID=42055 RepID=A0A4R7NPD3_9GAMM|nr:MULTISPECIES: twin-arginine translocation pathway signal [Chromohalobacter]MCI0508902.1 twin-arginine translocation pathway signal [Chromohalobacter sp.]MCI0594241.1 twin-arginine translocation pathway signal [Chromohalobacter sp.]TDU22723.1 secreted protein [Chromohalobacter marismortui]